MLFSSEQAVRRHEADVLVLGSGAAGCGAALAAVESGASVLLLDKARLESSGCNIATHTASLPFPSWE